MLTRRQILAGAAAVMAQPAAAAAPARAITRGPHFHWFGYYDKLQFDASNRYVLGMEARFEHRSPTPADTIRIGMVDLNDGDRWIDLGETHSWCWQQGCMLQWLPGSREEVIYNDRVNGQFISHILNVKTGKRRTLPAPIYAVSADAKWAVYPDFRRLNDTRPGYGYCGIPDPNREAIAPKNAGIWRMDLRNGKTELIFSIAEAHAIPFRHGDWTGAKHWFNHLLFASEGHRFCFLHRWAWPDRPGRITRMFTMDVNGRGRFELMPYGNCSHFIWRDARHVLAWSRHPSHHDRFYVWRDQSDEVTVVGKDVMTADGHCTYLPGNQWILNDTYPDAERNQKPYLYHVASEKRIELGRFLSPKEYTGEWRCDTHPRFSRDGKLVTVDSPHAGGRQIQLINVSGIVATPGP